MAKLADNVTQTTDPVVGDFAFPDKDALGWTPAEHVAVVLDAHDPVVPVYAPDPGFSEAEDDIEFAIADLPVGSLLVDLDAPEIADFDLNELLGGAGTEEVSVATPDPANEAGASDPVEASVLDALHDAGIPDPSQLALQFQFQQLTFVIDDEPGQGTVAL